MSLLKAWEYPSRLLLSNGARGSAQPLTQSPKTSST